MYQDSKSPYMDYIVNEIWLIEINLFSIVPKKNSLNSLYVG